MNQALQPVTVGMHFRSLILCTFFFLIFLCLSLVTLQCSGEGCCIKCVHKFKLMKVLQRIGIHFSKEREKNELGMLLKCNVQHLLNKDFINMQNDS